MPEPSRSLLALILAGGEGTRLLPLTRDRAKPAVPFGGRYRLIDFVLSNFVNSGFFQIKVLTQYKASSLISHITRGWQLAPILGHYVEPVPAQMRVGRDWFKGSADAVFQNLNLIADSQPEVVAVFGADHIYKMDVSQMVTLHLEKDADLTIAAVPVPRAQATAFGVLAVDAEGRVTDFVEKPADPPEMPGRPGWSLASMGNYLFRTQNLVEAITQDATRVDSVHDFGRNIISQMVRDGRVYAYDFDTNEPPGMEEKERGYWRDVGTLDSYWEASMDLVEVTPIFNLYNHRWPIRTTYQHLPPAKFVFNLEGPGRRGYATDSLVSPGGIISGGHVHRSVLAPKVRVHSWSEVEASVLGEGCEIHRGARVRRAIFDKFVTVEEGATVGFDPEHDRARGLTVTESGVVAATKGLHIPPMSVKGEPMPGASSVAFLWHFHQPDYRDPVAGRPILPWVRLHASRAYFDLAWLHERHPGFRSTVNFVPVLVDQLQAFIAGERDRYWELARKPARDLTPPERAFIVDRFFAIHPEHGVRPRPRYHALRALRAQGPDAFSVADLRDLQALFNLAWFGFAARVEYPFLAEMEQKGRGFREDEKRKILDLQVHVARRILPLWRRLAERGQVELTTTPYAHPILPLLIDSDVMGRCQPTAPRPPRFAFPADAEAQIARARDRHAAWTGVAPVGLWPAEGAVSHAAAELLVAQGIGHLATDEAQLFRSLPPETPRSALYQPWRLPVAGGHLDLVFRDRALSDLIGFTYASNDAEVAVDDLLGRVRAAAASAPHPRPLVTIALDGENPWDAYPESGRRFLQTLASRLEAATDLQAVTLAEHLAAAPPTATLSDLAPGSWINGDFGIWIGGSVENTAWRLLGDARRALETVGPTRPPADAAAARDHLLVAEGSDWFWWFGEPFHGENDADFDHLFRSRLRAAWLALGLPVPDAVEHPLDPPAPVAPVAEPRQLLRPRFAPADSTWFEWAGAGVYALEHGVAAMYQATRWFVRLLYGFDLAHAYFRLEPAEGADTAGMTLRLRLHGGADLHVVDVPLDEAAGEATLARLDPDLTPRGARPLTLVKRRRGIVEIGVPFADLGLVAGDPLHTTAFLMRERVCLARYPAAGDVRVTVPDAQFEARHWTA